MTTFTKPVASSIGGLDFGVLSQDDIKAISVKRIYNTPTLDSFNNPVPAGLYDPALGAWGDHLCTTCRMTSWSCTGHSGHIELPIHVFNITFFDQMFRLLKAQCVYCQRLRISRLQVNDYICKLRLLQYGLVNEAALVDKIGRTISRASHTHSDPLNRANLDEDLDGDSDTHEPGNTLEFDLEDLIEKRKDFTKQCIKLAKLERTSEPTAGAKDPVAAEERRQLLRIFFKDIVATKKCSSCHGIAPGYRKDRFSKIFRKPLLESHKLKMKVAGMNISNPLVMVRSHQEKEEARGRKVSKGPVYDDLAGTKSSMLSELHGAEEEILRANAVLSQPAGTTREMTDDNGGFVPSLEVYAALKLLFQKEGEILELVYNSRPLKRKPPVNADMFFIKNILVPPNKFRPAAAQSPNQIVEGDQNGLFNEILKSCDLINQISRDRQQSIKESVPSRWTYTDLLQATISLQEAVNGLIDKDRAGYSNVRLAKASNGIKQTLEKKEGLFRKNMMGKRVNFAARSVISPDPNIETNEIGVPLVFAKKLTYPEPVTNRNFWEMKQAVINGPDKYPGASAIENEAGQVINLKFKTLDERTALANQLLAPSNWRMKGTRNKKVYRHLTTGDVVLMNRQPTLHKPSIMGHKARVLPNERTIRMHYANCNTYNADFDGDEMNMHFPQNELARAEAMMLADADHQYLVGTSGKPLRGLIQDHISMGTSFTSRDTFFDREDYHQLLYSCLRPENAHTVSDKIKLMPPTIFKPQPLWTGKQVISTVLKNITPYNCEGLYLNSKSSTPGNRWGEGSEEDNVIVRDGELLCGILDKKQLGPTAGGLIDSIHEIYGPTTAGKLIGILGRLLTKFLHMHAFTCGMDDLRLTKYGDCIRREKLSEAAKIGRDVALKYVTLDKATIPDIDAELRRRLEDVLRDDQKQSGLDSVSTAQMSKLTSELTAACLPKGLVKQFPRNHMQSMTISGAKGSGVNANLISSNLGQQVLEGRRVPVMVSGKTLPSFRPFETHPIAGGYVLGRFLTGIKPQEYYFHTMAGREGLIDTAVKTSRSGYLQRCLIKGMEGLKAEYDTSVRDTTDGSVVQFLYGEDGLDITKQVQLKNFQFLAANHMSVMSQINVSDFHNLENPRVAKWHKAAMKEVRKTGKLDAMDPVLSRYHPGGNFGSVSEAFSSALKIYIKDNEDKLIRSRKTGVDGIIGKKGFETMMNMKYLNSTVEPGEAVGIVASQSVGEPSTQMTLNTFHLAGHSAKNVTLGIPRLREIVMTASTNIMTPTMRLNLVDEITPEEGEKFAKSISRLSLAEVIDKLEIKESVSTSATQANSKIYDIYIDFFPAEEYIDEYAIQIEDVFKAVCKPFVARLHVSTTKELKKREEEKKKMGNSSAQPDIGLSVGAIEEAPRITESGESNDVPDDDNDEDQDDAKRSLASMNRSHQISYEGPDEDEQSFIQQVSTDFDSDDEDNNDNERRQTNKEQLPEDPNDRDASEEVEVKPGDVKEFGRRAKLAIEDVKGRYSEITGFKFDSKSGSSCHIQLKYDISTPKLLLLPLVEDAARNSVIHHIPGIRHCIYVPADPLKEQKAYVETEGVSLVAMWDYQDIIHPHSLRTNSIFHMLELYGVEAARASIVREMDDVFKGHSISVDNRHLNLIGDVMTHSGGFRAFNRNGLVLDSSSPLAKMSFETTVGFLRDAVLEGDYDNLRNPSSRIVVGRVGSVGTGGFDVLAPVA